MTESEKRALAWKKIKGSEKLFKIYHYYPSFHDACVNKVNCDFEKREVCLTFDYSDMVGNDVDSIASTLITMCWENVFEANFCFDDNDIYSMKLEFIDDAFETILSGAYFEGRLKSKSLKVTEVVLKPEVSDESILTNCKIEFSLK